MKRTVRRSRTEMHPCRKCGYDRVRRTDRVYLGMDEGYLIECPRCRAKSSIGYLIQDAVDAWNAENPVTLGEVSA